ncbi:hypothetical protein V8F33_006008 [Rhypophila sp. PSN 637]
MASRTHGAFHHPSESPFYSHLNLHPRYSQSEALDTATLDGDREGREQDDHHALVDDTSIQAYRYFKFGYEAINSTDGDNINSPSTTFSPNSGTQSPIYNITHCYRSDTPTRGRGDSCIIIRTCADNEFSRAEHDCSLYNSHRGPIHHNRDHLDVIEQQASSYFGTNVQDDIDLDEDWYSPAISCSQSPSISRSTFATNSRNHPFDDSSYGSYQLPDEDQTNSDGPFILQKVDGESVTDHPDPYLAALDAQDHKYPSEIGSTFAHLRFDSQPQDHEYTPEVTHFDMGGFDSFAQGQTTNITGHRSECDQVGIQDRSDQDYRDHLAKKRHRSGGNQQKFGKKSCSDESTNEPAWKRPEPREGRKRRLLEKGSEKVIEPPCSSVAGPGPAKSWASRFLKLGFS